MKTILFMIFIFIYFLGFYSYSFKFNSLVSMLLSLEFMNLILFGCLFVLVEVLYEKYILLFYLTFCVCEGAFGLSLLVLLIRAYGMDYLFMMNFLKC